MLSDAAEFPLPGPLDLGLTLGILQRGGARDRTILIESSRAWRASWTPDGAATLRLEVTSTTLRAQAWGPGSGWAVLAAPALVGLDDDPGSFHPHHPLLSTIHRSHRGLRLGRTGRVFEALVPTVLEQKVPGLEAWASYAAMVSALGEPAPGEGELLMPPTPRRLLATPYWTFHRFGIERRKADVIRNAALLARRLDDLVQLASTEATRLLLSLPGVGPWSAAEVAAVAFGDRDAVSVGDYNLPHMVSWVLAGEPRGSDARMLELLEPYRGHRARVIRLLATAGITAPRFGPRMPLRRLARR